MPAVGRIIKPIKKLKFKANVCSLSIAHSWGLVFWFWECKQINFVLTKILLKAVIHLLILYLNEANKYSSIYTLGMD